MSEYLTALDAARVMFESDRPTAAEREKARRRLVKLAEQGLIRVVETGDKGSKTFTRWGA